MKDMVYYWENEKKKKDHIASKEKLDISLIIKQDKKKLLN